MNRCAAHMSHTCSCVCQYMTHSPMLRLTTPLGMNTDPLPGMLHSTKLNSLRLTTNILAWSPDTCKLLSFTTASTDLCSTNTQEYRYRHNSVSKPHLHCTCICYLTLEKQTGENQFQECYPQFTVHVLH